MPSVTVSVDTFIVHSAATPRPGDDTLLRRVELKQNGVVIGSETLRYGGVHQMANQAPYTTPIMVTADILNNEPILVSYLFMNMNQPNDEAIGTALNEMNATHAATATTLVPNTLQQALAINPSVAAFIHSAAATIGQAAANAALTAIQNLLVGRDGAVAYDVAWIGNPLPSTTAEWAFNKRCTGMAHGSDYEVRGRVILTQ